MLEKEENFSSAEMASQTKAKMPDAEIYEQEFEYFPWGKLVDKAVAQAVQKAPANSNVVDLMCGTGHSLNELKKKRPDLNLEGVDSSGEFIEFAEKNIQGVKFELEDVLVWQPDKKYKMVISTGGLHHLDYKDQPAFLKKVGEMLEDDGLFVFGDPFVGDYSNEQERKAAAAKLGDEYIAAAKEKNASDGVIYAAERIKQNDIDGFEYKTSLAKMKELLAENFEIESVEKTWPEHDSQYGDYLLILRKKKKGDFCEGEVG